MTKIVCSNLRVEKYQSSLNQQLMKLIDNKAIDIVIKMLEEYLEKKRDEQPRFYFLSNDELLLLLANQHDIAEVNLHMNKCFDNVKALVSGMDNNILELLSNEGEAMVFSKQIKFKKDEGIENVLKKVEDEM